MRLEGLTNFFTEKNKPLPENHWLEIAEKLAVESDGKFDPLQIRAAALIRALGLPSGEVSAFGTNSENRQINKKQDSVIAEQLTNKAGVVIDKEKGMVSSDFRDIYPKGLPKELSQALNPEARAIMEVEYRHAQDVKTNPKDYELAPDWPVHYFRLQGGIDLFLRGYDHDRDWHQAHKQFFEEANKHAQLICIEGDSEIPYGESLAHWWGEKQGDFDALMHEAVEAGFKGLFAEVDARDKSKIKMDNLNVEEFGRMYPIFPDLPEAFFQNYFMFFRREHPLLAEKIGTPDKLKQLLQRQSRTMGGIHSHDKRILKKGKLYGPFAYVSKDGKDSLDPTFREIGQVLFTDALAAIKLHLIAKLMADGHITKGPIIDYEGGGHLSSKTFFLRYPNYAAEVVLRTINELMAGKVKEKGNLPEIYKVFTNPDWTEIVKEIAKLAFGKIGDDPYKRLDGKTQKKLLNYPVDALKIYNIDPTSVMPSKEEISAIGKKFQKPHTAIAA